MRSIIRYLIGLAAPFLLIGAGSLLVAAWGEYGWTYAGYVGVALIAAGVVWGALLWFAADAGSPFD